MFLMIIICIALAVWLLYAGLLVYDMIAHLVRSRKNPAAKMPPSPYQRMKALAREQKKKVEPEPEKPFESIFTNHESETNSFEWEVSK